MRYFRISLAAMLVAYVFAFSSIAYIACALVRGLDVDAGKFLSLWFCALAAAVISWVAFGVEQREMLAKWYSAKSEGIEQNAE